MGAKMCFIQETCPKYISGDNKPPNNDIRNKVVCRSSLAMTCEMDINLRLWHGEVIACEIAKIKRIKGG